ncbi:MAG: tyrosine-type recombinase/integrase [Planctomycetaceae bacterium]|nr:tyrosine-type recombinase/integrase [Planctomycetaceae bacterium]
MAQIVKRIRTVIDTQTGEKIRKESEKWWCRYRDALGIEHRKPLAKSKAISQQMLQLILEAVEKEKSGVVTPSQKEAKRPIKQQIDDFEQHQKAKNNTGEYVSEIVQKVRVIAEYCGWNNVLQIRESDVEGFLLHLRTELGRSIQTSNNYLRAIKCFVHWLKRNKRITSNPLEGMKMLNACTDRRHDRRPLEDDEFARVLYVAETGPPRMGLIGRDRAMLYLLAAWTGFRRGELGSLTLRSFDFDAPTPTVTVKAMYSKHRRMDVQILHPDIVERFKEWLAKRKPKNEDEILFPISKKTCGTDRKTSAMLEFDLASARRFWIAETDDPVEKRRREESEFLLYRNKAGLFADFHGLRHTFITNLGKAGVDPKTAQILARHSDIHLTMNIYTHVNRKTEIAAINALPSVPKSITCKSSQKNV